MIGALRSNLGIDEKSFECSYRFKDLDDMTQLFLTSECQKYNFLKEENPVLRHVILRKRKQLEDIGLLEKIGVNIHPMKKNLALYEGRFTGLGILTNSPFQVAYRKAEEFTKLLRRRAKNAGFIKSLMLRRICSSFASGLKTIQNMLQHTISDEEEEGIVKNCESLLSNMTLEEVACLEEIKTQLSKPEAVDTKLDIVKWFLSEFRTDEKTWLEQGCIIFNQYYDTVEWIAKELSKFFTKEVVAVYAGGRKSGFFREAQFSSVGREDIKSRVKNREIRLIVATDSACESLNLQTLGTLINVDLPWNPARLEQRLGRIKRFGQVRKSVDLLNLVYCKTLDEEIYDVVSKRFRDVYDIFGSLPDTIKDEWIDDVIKLEKHMDEYIHERKKAQDAFSVKYQDTLNPDDNLWEQCKTVLSRNDIVNALSRPWDSRE
ncbi:helicase-related protein [Bartonella sp. B35(2025)]